MISPPAKGTIHAIGIRNCLTKCSYIALAALCYDGTNTQPVLANRMNKKER